MSRTRSAFGLPIVVIAALGCGGSGAHPSGPGGPNDVAEAKQADVDQAGAGEDEDQSTADLAEHHRHHHHGGFALFIALSIDSLNATPEQTAAIAKIREDLHAKMQPAHAAEKVVLATLAQGIATGAIDQAKIDAQIAELKTAAAGVHDAVADSLNALHEVLTPAQRVALVDKVEAHFEVWHHANAPHERAERDGRGGHLGRLAKELGLSEQQVATIRASFASSMGGAAKFDRAQAEEHMKAFGAAFASDHFDAHAVATGGPLNASMAAWGMGRTVRFYEAVLPALTPEQRTKLADELTRHANYQRSNDNSAVDDTRGER